MGVIVGIFVQDSKRKETMDQIARRRRLPVVMFTAVLLVAVLVLPAYRAVAQSTSPQTQAFHENVKEVYFPFNIYNRIVDKATLDSNAQWLKQNPDAKMWIQGYADPRG